MMKNGMTRLLAALCLWALLWALPAGLAEPSTGEAVDITRKCAFKVSEGSRDKLLNGNVRDVWSYKRDTAYVGIKLPKEAQAGWLRVEWLFEPKAYELIEYDDALNPIRTRDQSVQFPNIYSVYPLLPEARYLQLKLNAKGQSLSGIKVYSAGTLPEEVQLWEPPVDKADLMVVSTHQDDEIIFLGGTIPYYATALKKPTVVVYMTNCGRGRRAEALNALWVMGVKNYPDFINLQDDKVDSVEQGIELWGGKDAVLSLMVARIRRYKPEVIVTQDLNGEYGHNQHKITARLMKYAIDAAADSAQYPESGEIYGAWQVKKLYHHLYEENQIVMNWEIPLESLGGETALKLAKRGMKEHSSQTQYYAVKSHGTYDNSKFGLYFTTVGEDVAKNDFLEHIDPDASAKYLTEHADEIAARKAAAEATPTPEPTEVPPAETPEPVDEEAPAVADADEAPAEAEAPEGEGEAFSQPTDRPAAAGEPLTPTAPQTSREGRGAGTLLPIAMVALGVAAIGVGAWYGWRMLARPGRRRRKRR